MTMHSLTKSAIFFAVGHIAQVKGTQKIADMGGLTVTNPVLGWGLVLGVVAIAGLPPLGIFMSEFLVVSSTFAREPWLAIILAFGILVALGGLFLRLNTIAFGAPRGPTAKAEASYVPMFAAPGIGVHGRHLYASSRWSRALRMSRGCWDSHGHSRHHNAQRRGRAAPALAPCSGRMTKAGARPSTSSQQAAWCCLAYGAMRPMVHMALLDEPAGESRSSATPANPENIRASAPVMHRRFGSNVRSAIYSVLKR